MSSLVNQERLGYMFKVYELLKHYISNFKLRNNSLMGDVARSGVLVVPGFLSEMECDSLIEEFEELASKSSIKIWSDQLESDTRIFGVDKLSERFESFLKDSKLDLYRRQYLKVGLKSDFSMMNRLLYKKGNQGSGGGWHRDSPFTHQFKAIAYLVDVDEKTGPFQYIAGSHRVSSILRCSRILRCRLGKYRFSELEVDELIESGESIESVVGKKGDLILVDTKCIHRGKPIESGKRYAIFNYYFDGDIPQHFEKILN